MRANENNCYESPEIHKDDVYHALRWGIPSKRALVFTPCTTCPRRDLSLLVCLSLVLSYVFLFNPVIAIFERFQWSLVHVRYVRYGKLLGIEMIFLITSPVTPYFEKSLNSRRYWVEGVMAGRMSFQCFCLFLF